VIQAHVGWLELIKNVSAEVTPSALVALVPCNQKLLRARQGEYELSMCSQSQCMASSRTRASFTPGYGSLARTCRCETSNGGRDAGESRNLVLAAARDPQGAIAFSIGNCSGGCFELLSIRLDSSARKPSAQCSSLARGPFVAHNNICYMLSLTVGGMVPCSSDHRPAGDELSTPDDQGTRPSQTRHSLGWAASLTTSFERETGMRTHRRGGRARSPLLTLSTHVRYVGLVLASLGKSASLNPSLRYTHRLAVYAIVSR